MSVDAATWDAPGPAPDLVPGPCPAILHPDLFADEVGRVEPVAAAFGAMTPHAFAAVDGPAELIVIFDRDGQRAHDHREHP
jgi:hypothetical protein